jgi:hypothetical protein
LRIPLYKVEEPAITEVPVLLLEEREEGRRQSDVESESGWILIQRHSLSDHRLLDIESKGTDFESLMRRMKGSREPNRPLLSGLNSAGIPIHDVVVRVHSQTTKPVFPGPIPGEVVAILIVRIGGHRYVDWSESLMERVVVESA